MPAKPLASDEKRRRKRTVGIAAIVLLLFLTILALLDFISLAVWIIADLIVALIANFLFRRIGRAS
jgi:uncharacterized membrane protein